MRWKHVNHLEDWVCAIHLRYISCWHTLNQHDFYLCPHYAKAHNIASNEGYILFATIVMRCDLPLCLSLGADFNTQDKHGRTCLHLATKYQGVDTIQWLVERGCLPTTPDSQGQP